MRRVLFIDDEIDTLQTYKKGVELFGHEALTAEDGQAGVDLAQQTLPDVVFVDMQMAGLSGLEVVRALRQDERTAAVPTYVLSAGPELDVEELVRAAGAAGYLLKPIRLQTLLDAIEGTQAAEVG